ncbi:MAG: class I SAM-dependent methyltransferase [Myxococcota bacterium]|nr:class I SAM-dependent methyltransferase [Myxococcota bacterium]
MADKPKSFNLSPEVHAYLVEHGAAPDPIARELIEETAKLGSISIMQIAPEQGAFMTLLARLMGARRIIEIGTFTGYSALCLARGLPADGRLICCDVSEEWTRVGLPYWERAGVADRIDLRIAPALETLAELAGKGEEGFDLAFVDADKQNYRPYCEALAELVRPGGVILVDNVLWGGAVVDPANTQENTEAIRAFNDWAAREERFEGVMLPVSDGLTLLRIR